jgi:hypothetical protein
MIDDLKIQTKNSLTKSHQGPLRVVYIAGVGRSGSTVLDSVLGNHPLIQSVGELAKLVSDVWLQNYEHYCSCGERSKNCPFWFAVKQTWCNSNGTIALPKYIELQNKVEKVPQWPLLLPRSWQSTRTFQVYAEQTVLLLKAIQLISGCTTIVDSSKGVERAFALSLIPDIDLKVIQLVRDPRGVVWSNKKAFTKDLKHGLTRDIHPKPAWRAALYWCRVNLGADWLRRRVGPEKALLVRYEDFMLQTLPVLQKIGNFIGVNLIDVQRVIDEGGKLSFGHTIAGNRVRMKGELKLKYDRDWLQNLSLQDRRVTELLSGWLMARYGYKP